MFVPVNCTNCAKPFQVPEAALGKPTLCPWCQQVVAALLVGAVVDPSPAPSAVPAPPAPAPAVPAPPVQPAGGPKSPGPTWLKKYTTERPRARPVSAPPRATATYPRPLSLDDESARPIAPPAPKGRRVLNPVPVVIGIAITLAVTVLTVAALGYGSGRVQESFWTEYTAPDGSCSVLLPAPPSEEDVEPNPNGSVIGGKRFAARGWYTRSAAWLAWNDLSPAFAKDVTADKDRLFTASALKAELEREKSRLQGTVTKEAVVQSSSAWGYEVHMDTPRGKVVEWLLVAPDGPRPRLYVYGLQATNISHDSAIVRRMFTSFQVHE